MFGGRVDYYGYLWVLWCGVVLSKYSNSLIIDSGIVVPSYLLSIGLNCHCADGIRVVGLPHT